MTLIPAWVKSGLDTALAPIVARLITGRVQPNIITTVAALVVLAGAVAFGGGLTQWGGALVLLSGGLDMVDGKVARHSGTTSKFGAFYDSTLDRVGDAALFGGIATYFLRGGAPPGWMTEAVLVTIFTLAAGLLVSYTRARAEGLGLDCKVGIATRAERILLLGVPTMFLGAGPDGYLLLGIVAVLALIGMVTVVQRVVYVYRITREVTVSSPRREPATAPIGESLGKGRSGV